jgi:hypothetical protein
VPVTELGERRSGPAVRVGRSTIVPRQPVAVGDRVIVPFGRRKMIGVVVDLP